MRTTLILALLSLAACSSSTKKPVEKKVTNEVAAPSTNEADDIGAGEDDLDLGEEEGTEDPE